MNVQSILALEWGVAKWKLRADWGLCPRPANLKSNFSMIALTTLLGFFCGLLSLHPLAPMSLSSGFCPAYTLPGHSLWLLWLQSPPKKLMFTKPASLVQTCARITYFSSNHLITHFPSTRDKNPLNLNTNILLTSQSSFRREHSLAPAEKTNVIWVPT